MKTRRLASACLFAGLAAAWVQAEDLAATLGKQRAAGSRMEWEIRDAGHPRLGTIRFAYLKTPVETAAGNAKVFSRAYLSCERLTRKLAVELTNTTTPDDPGGLQPAREPRLVCTRPTGPGQQVQEPLLATWEVDPKTGDALARGLRAFPLRECVSIRAEQEVTLPAGSPQKTARVEFDLLPYSRALDAIFATCGEQSAYGPAAAPPVVAAAAPKPAALPAPSKPPDSGWQMTRVITTGKTNVRAGPRLDSPVVVQLDPGATVLVQRTGTEWLRARAAKGAAFDGFIRQDRLLLK
jgi:Bacterial SH3 domain